MTNQRMDDFLNRLLKDEAFRTAFLQNREDTLAGFGFSPAEKEGLLRLDVPAVLAAAKTLAHASTPPSIIPHIIAEERKNPPGSNRGPGSHG